MASMPTEQQLKNTLVSAGKAHHDYEANFLGGCATSIGPASMPLTSSVASAIS